MAGAERAWNSHLLHTREYLLRHARARPGHDEWTISLALREQVCFLSARGLITVNAMYQPEHYRVADVGQMHALMHAKPLATFISCGSSGLYATHLPTVLKDEGACGVIECHLARANPHWKDLAAATEALMIFQGPEAYITPNWYPSKTLHGKVVPTWNYAVVHAYGRPEVMQDKEWLRRHVSELTAQQERNETQPWLVTDAPASYIDVMLRGIVGFRFPVTRLEGKWKMSQNRDMQDRDGVAKGLGQRGDGDDVEMAELVSRYIVPND